jgi:hypothetical protein
MQDIGGCRAVVNTVTDVDRLHNLFSRGRSLHELFDESDYIATPKSSGYRSLHLIYRFRSRSRSEFNGLLMEVQIRTRLQHAWATAVETVGAVLGQALKSSEGEAAWLTFFQNAGSAFARLESTPVVPGGPDSSGQLARMLSAQLRNLDIRRKLSAYRAALKMTEQKEIRDAAYFLLVLRPDAPKLEIFSYTRRNMDRAYRDYQRLEQALPLFPNERQMSLFPELNDYSGAQAVLIGADSLRSIRDSFPNYYLDTETFLEEIDSFIRRFRRSR